MGGADGSGWYRFVGQADWRSWWGLVGGVVRGWWEGLVEVVGGRAAGGVGGDKKLGKAGMSWQQ